MTILDRCAEIEEERDEIIVREVEPNALLQLLRRRTGAENFPAEWIPPTCIGAWSGDRLLAAAALYLERNTPVAVAGWIAAAAENPPPVSARAADALLRALPRYAHRHGARHLLTTFGHPYLNRKLDCLGFLSGDVGVEHKFLFLG